MDLIQARNDIREEIEFVQRICDSYVTHGGAVVFRLRERLQKIYEELLALDCSEPKPDFLAAPTPEKPQQESEPLSPSHKERRDA